MTALSSPSRNLEIALALERLGGFLELDGADRFRARAYLRAARSVAAAPYDVLDRVRHEGDPGRLPGVGARLGAVIREYARSGRIARLEELEARYPPGLLAFLRIPRLDARRIRLLHERLGIADLAQLRQAAEEGRLAGLRGIGPRLQERILDWLGEETDALRLRRADALRLVPGLLRHFRSRPGVEAVHVAGSLRRCREVVTEIDLVLVLEEGRSLPDDLGSAGTVLEADGSRVALRLSSGLRVNLFAARRSDFGTVLLLRTGSAAHVEQLEAVAVRRGVDLGAPARREEAVYETLGLGHVEPELREGRGEVEAASRGSLPRLVTLEDLRGDLHSHTDETDGRDSLERMTEAAAERGLRYLAVSDHTQSLKICRGQDEARLAAQIVRIDRLNAKLKGLTLLKSAEVDILEDGRLDLPDGILRELDLTVCSVHSKFNLNPSLQTERVLRAIEHPSFRILGHPTGRLLLRRRGHPLDVSRLIRAAREHGRILELNSQPDRLDLDDQACREAKEAGVLIAISSDAHSVAEFGNLRWGVDQARRGWLEPKDVANALELPDLLRVLGRNG